MQPFEADDGLQPIVVEREIASVGRRLVFAEPIETLFERGGRAARLRLITLTSLIAVVIYNLFLALDWFLLNDVFAMMAIGRICIFTPIVLGMLWFAHVRPSKHGMDIFSMLSGLLAILIPTIVMVQSDSSSKLDYQYTNALIIMFGAVVQRARFYYTLATLVSSVAIHFVIISSIETFDFANFLAITMFYLTVLIHLSLASYILEYTERRSFLFALHATLLRDRIARAARTDPLTGLFNRRYLSEFFESLHGSSPRTLLAILLDIDHFKTFNDSRGHIEGDACLRSVSACVAEVAAPSGGVTFRFGGEEVLVLVPEMDFGDGMRMAEAMRAAIEAAAIPHPALGVGRVVTASVGVAGAVAPDVVLDDLIAAADTALYAAKRAGRNRVLPGLPASPESGGAGRAEAALPSRTDAGEAVAPAAILC